MTWIGKILTILVMIASIVWMFLNVQAYVTRTNWYEEAKKYREGFAKANAAREAEYQASRADLDAVRKEADRYKNEVTTLNGELTKRDDALTAAKKEKDDLTVINTNLANENNQSNANLAAAREQVAQLRAQNDTLETSRVQLVRQRETANTEKQQAINDKNGTETKNEQLMRDREKLEARIYAMKQSGAKEPNEVQVALAPKITPLPENVRGTVIRVDGDFVELSIGLDAGLSAGAILDISRYKPDAKYLGKVTVTNMIEPKKAIASFRPADQRSFAQLRPDERPRIGDLVSVISR